MTYTMQNELDLIKKVAQLKQLKEQIKTAKREEFATLRKQRRYLTDLLEEAYTSLDRMLFLDDHNLTDHLKDCDLFMPSRDYMRVAKLQQRMYQCAKYITG